MSWPEVYNKIFDELWEQIKRINNLSDEDKPVLPPLPAKATKFPPEDRRWVQAFVTFITMNYKIDLISDDLDEIVHKPVFNSDTTRSNIRKNSDFAKATAPIPYGEEIPPPPPGFEPKNYQFNDNFDEESSDDRVPVLNAGFMGSNQPKSEEIIVEEDEEEENIEETQFEENNENEEKDEGEEPLSDSFTPTQKIEKKHTKKTPDFPEPPEYKTDLDWDGLSKELVMILMEDTPEFIKNTVIKDFLTKRQSKIKDNPQQLFKDPTFIGSLVQLTSSFGEMRDIIPSLDIVHEHLYEFLCKLPGAYIPENEDVKKFPKLFKVINVSSTLPEGTVIKFINPSFFTPKSKRPRICSEVYISDVSTTEPESFIRNNTELLRKILLQYLPKLPDIYTLTLDRFSKTFGSTGDFDISTEDIINVVNVLSELNYFFSGFEFDQLFDGIMKYTDCLSEILQKFDVSVFPRTSMPMTEENVQEFGDVVIAHVPDPKPENTVLRIKRRGIKSGDEILKNAVIVLSAGETLKELSKSFSLAAQLIRSPAFYASNKRGTFFENVSKFDEYLLKYIKDKDHESKGAGFLRDLINHLDEMNHPNGFSLSKPLLTVTNGISNYLQRRYSIEEFPVMVGGKYDRTYPVKNYSVQRVRRSGKATDTIIGVRQRGYEKTDGTFLQNCILWVAE